MTPLQRITQSISSQQPENQSTEYKGELYKCTETSAPNEFVRKKDKLELLKDVCAMANGGGGSIILGIHQDNQGIPLAEENSHGLAEKIPPKYTENIEQMISALIFPRLTIHCEQVGYETEGKTPHFIVISIPAPSYPLYCVQANSNVFEYHIRSGRQTRQMNPSDIVLQLAQFDRSQQSRVSERVAFLDQFRSQPESTPTLVVVMQPVGNFKIDVLSNDMLRNKILRGIGVEQSEHWQVVEDKNNHFPTPTFKGITLSRPNFAFEVRRSGAIYFHRKLRHSNVLARLNLLDDEVAQVGDFWLINNSFLKNILFSCFRVSQAVYSSLNLQADLEVTAGLVNSHSSFLQFQNEQVFQHADEPVIDLDLSSISERDPKQCMDNQLVVETLLSSVELSTLDVDQLSKYISSTILDRFANGFGLEKLGS